MEDGWDMVSMVREGFDLEEMVVRTTIREQSSSNSGLGGPNLVMRSLPRHLPSSTNHEDLGEWALGASVATQQVVGQLEQGLGQGSRNMQGVLAWGPSVSTTMPRPTSKQGVMGSWRKPC